MEGGAGAGLAREVAIRAGAAVTVVISSPMATVAVGRPLSGSAAGLVRALRVALPGLRDDPVGLVVHQREAVGGEVVAQLADAVLVEAEDALAVVLAGAKE